MLKQKVVLFFLLSINLFSDEYHQYSGDNSINIANSQNIKIIQNIQNGTEKEITKIGRQISVETYDSLLIKVDTILKTPILKNIEKYQLHGKLFQKADLVFETGTGIDTNYPSYNAGKYSFNPGNIGIILGRNGDTLEVFWKKQEYVSKDGSMKELDEFISNINYRYVKRKFTYKDSKMGKRK